MTDERAMEVWREANRALHLAYYPFQGKVTKAQADTAAAAIISQATATLQAEVAALKAELAEAREKLGWYANHLCELSTDHECCGRMTADDCGGCLARAYLKGEPK